MIVPGLTGVSAVETGHYHSLALKGGVVWVWGHNDVGQLGDGTLVQRRIPVQVPGITDAIALRSLDAGRLAAKSAYCRPSAPAPPSSRGSSACTMHRLPRAATSVSARTNCSPSRLPNSGTPEGERKTFTPKTPAATSGPSEPRFSGTAPPQKPTSTASLPAVPARLAYSDERALLKKARARLSELT